MRTRVIYHEVDEDGRKWRCVAPNMLYGAFKYLKKEAKKRHGTYIKSLDDARNSVSREWLDELVCPEAFVRVFFLDLSSEDDPKLGPLFPREAEFKEPNDDPLTRCAVDIVLCRLGHGEGWSFLVPTTRCADNPQPVNPLYYDGIEMRPKYSPNESELEDGSSSSEDDHEKDELDPLLTGLAGVKNLFSSTTNAKPNKVSRLTDADQKRIAKEVRISLDIDGVQVVLTRLGPRVSQQVELWACSTHRGA